MIELTNFKEEMRSALQTIKRYSRNGDLAILKQIKVTSFDLPLAKPIDMLAIDGSHAFILNFSSKWLAIIKIAALLYELVEGEKIGFKLKEAFLLEKPVIVSAERDEYLNLANEMLRYHEQMVLNTLASRLWNTLIVMDGSLAMPLKNTSALKSCEENKNLLAGISKDSNTRTFGASIRDEELLSFHPHRGLGYVKVKVPIDGGDVYFAKLFPNAKRWFRVDIAGRAGEIFPQLASYSRSQLCPGYPYPLLEAHRFAVSVRHFKERYEEVLFNLAASEGIELERIAAWRTNVDGEKINSFHKYLDEVAGI